MDPVWRDFGQGAHDKKAFMRPGMGQNQIRLIHHASPKGDKIKIQGPGGIGETATAPKAVFQIEKGAQGLPRRQGRLDKGDAIEIIRVSGIWPC